MDTSPLGTPAHVLAFFLYVGVLASVGRRILRCRAAAGLRADIYHAVEVRQWASLMIHGLALSSLLTLATPWSQSQQPTNVGGILLAIFVYIAEVTIVAPYASEVARVVEARSTRGEHRRRHGEIENRTCAGRLIMWLRCEDEPNSLLTFRIRPQPDYRIDQSSRTSSIKLVDHL
jgi:hypothetical protein